MKIYDYRSYDHYVKSQTEANLRKLHYIWVRKNTIEKIVEDNPKINSVLCHGTRNGKEQEYFKDLLPHAEIIGTEISHTAHDFPMTVQHDFHDPKEEWIHKFDIVYSNSFDHSHKPTICLQTWKNQLNENGSLYIEQGWSINDNKSCESDPLELTEEELLQLCENEKLKFKRSFEVEEKNSKVYRFKACQHIH